MHYSWYSRIALGLHPIPTRFFVVGRIGFWKYDAKQKETAIDVEGLKAMGVINIKPEFNYSDVWGGGLGMKRRIAHPLREGRLTVYRCTSDDPPTSLINNKKQTSNGSFI